MLGPPTKAHFILHESIPITPLFRVTGLNSRLFQNILKIKGDVIIACDSFRIGVSADSRPAGAL